MLKIRRPLGRLIFNMGIAIPGKTVFLIETAPRAYFPWQPLPWKHHKLPCFCILLLEFGGIFDIHKHEIVRLYIKITIDLQWKYWGTPDCNHMKNISIHLIKINMSKCMLIPQYRQFNMNLNEICLYERELNAPVHEANLEANRRNTEYSV